MGSEEVIVQEKGDAVQFLQWAGSLIFHGVEGDAEEFGCGGGANCFPLG